MTPVINDLSRVAYAENQADEARHVRKLEPVLRCRVLTALTALETAVRPSGVKELAGLGSGCRIRIGDCRVLYEIEDDMLLVTDFRAGNRRDVDDPR